MALKKSKTKSQKLNPFEDLLDLTTLVRLKKGGYTIGAYLLSKKQVGETNNTLQLVFGYSCRGIHPLFNSDEKVEQIAQAFENGCKEFAQGERYTFRWSSFCNEEEVIEHFRHRLSNPVNDESEFLDWGSVSRLQQLTRQKKRKNITLNVYATFTVKPGGTEAGDAVDRAIVNLSNFLQRRFTPTGATELTRKSLMQVLEKAINVSLRHQQILSEMGLNPTPKSEKELWQDLSFQVGAKPVKVPHTLVFSDGMLAEEFHESLPSPRQYIDAAHITSVLLNNGIPFADRKWVCISTPKKGQKYVGVLTLTQKPEAFVSTTAQVRFLWNIFARDVIYDIEIITEISPADQKIVRLTQQLITRRSRNAQMSASKKTIDVASQINTEWSVNAQKQLYTGDVPENVALIVLVYRDTPEEIDDACRLISGYVNQPAELSREMQYTWLIWVETLLLRQRPQLTSPYNRRTSFFASEVIGLTPAVQTSGADQQGFELIADEGHSPVSIDLSRTKNMMVIGTTGSGKSVLVSSIIAECLAMGMSILMIDLPNDDGSGTFGDFTPYYNGFYFDISKQSNNLVQPLDLSKIPLEQREDRVKAHRNDVNLIVLQLVLGSQQFDGFLAQTIESLIPLGTKAFYDDPDIQQRFESAKQGGLGSEAWANTATLVDLEQFFSTDHIDLGYEDENVDKALNYIRLRFQYWRASSIGDAICKPSTFETDSKLITFALTNLQSGKDAEVFGMSAYIAASRQSLSSPNSVFFMDEASVLLRFPALSRLVGRKCATARKSGCRIILAAQDVISIAKSEAGEQILQNMPLRLIGRIVPGASGSFSDLLGIPREIIDKNETFTPNVQQLYTLWLLDYNNKYIRCRYYPSYPLLALVANSREEQATRDLFKERYKNKFEWVAEFSKYYVDCIKQGKPL
ncbi:DUF87 domain-containing protein [Nostoc sp. FACHB-87]|uniref:helicase HerA domain-containing protein n=1 Tax=Nostocales TaxID=1161 RepID=UPI001683EC09|nr:MULTISPECIES: DUF87 domain-containing protein [Nostocales]MBD2458996.1 DUF87 domain-containing protein [Nostoc sp. FACHB-87]MBD2480007.1 DUF87 domain-containing protein [Anabaena sp. FACHB-83]MBD2492133.1 DUF87 domain-containing protein [Aulosira sp. FACHB-615]